MQNYALFATTPKAMEDILATELLSLGAEQLQATIAGIAFQGTLTTAYRICLWSRIANHVLLVLAGFSVKTQDDLYRGIQTIDWSEHLDPEASLAITFNAKQTNVFNNTHYGALKVKDAIVDQMRSKFNKRPSINTERPDLRVSVYLQGEHAQVAIDLSGDSLHRRGYRSSHVAAPIKENLAAAILMRSGWPALAQSGGSLCDPMCGSGTLLIEGALLVADYAPGLMRDYYGFLGWKKHDALCWERLKTEALQRKSAGLQQLPMIVGFDQDKHSIQAAMQHIDRAGLAGKIHIERREISAAEAADSWPRGLVACNPPYGERLGTTEEVALLYQKFGEVLKERFQGWQAALIISDPELGFRLGIRSHKPITFYNGALACKLLRLDVDPANFFIPKAKTTEQRLQQVAQYQEPASTGEHIDTGIEMFNNRLQKNLKKLQKWATEKQISCYRLYDADLPEYAVAIDIYESEQRFVNVQEYEPPKNIDPHKANQRLAAIMANLPTLLNIPKEHVFLKIRRKQKSTAQYQKQDAQGEFHVINEGGCLLGVNFADYLDTGLFLDHRPLRLRIQQQAAGKRFLNLFCYTASATMHAIKGGATQTTSVDMSNTYLEWAQRNMRLNQFDLAAHEFIQADCAQWLNQEAAHPHPRQYDLIFLDPPTFSNSKRMEDIFDIQRDHVELINNALQLLAVGGILYFSTNFRRFKLDRQAFADLIVEDISASTIDVDFARNPKIHYCWKIQE